MTPRDKRQERRFYLPSKRTEILVHSKISSDHCIGHISDISKCGVLIECDPADESIVDRLAKDGQQIDWAVDLHFGSAQLIRVSQNRIALSSRGFATLCAEIVSALRPCTYVLASTAQGLSEIRLIGNFDFYMAKRLVGHSSKVSSINLSQVDHICSSALGVVSRALEQGVKVAGCKGQVKQVLSMAQVCADCGCCDE